MIHVAWLRLPRPVNVIHLFQVISFQAAIVTDGRNKTFAIFHYKDSKWGTETSYARQILIGYSDGKSLKETNEYSNTLDANDMDENENEGKRECGCDFWWSL